MIHNNKKVPRSIPPAIIEQVRDLQNWRCLMQLPGCTGRMQGKPHHWGIHNTKPNRGKYPDLVHHPFNLAGVCLSCHQKRGSGDNLPEWAIESIRSWMVLGRDISMDFIDGEFQVFADDILIYLGGKN